MNKKILFLILLWFSIIPITVLAQAGAGLVGNMINNVVNVVIFIAGSIVIILWVVTGILFLSSLGDPGKLETAKKSLFAAIAGTLLIILAISAQAIISGVIFRGV